MNLLQLWSYVGLNYSNNYNSFEIWLVSCWMHVVSEGTQFMRLTSHVFICWNLQRVESSCTLVFCSLTNSGVTQMQANHCDSRMPLRPVMSWYDSPHLRSFFEIRVVNLSMTYKWTFHRNSVQELCIFISC